MDWFLLSLYYLYLPSTGDEMAQRWLGELGIEGVLGAQDSNKYSNVCNLFCNFLNFIYIKGK